ncbi:MAG: addiction module protein [Pseudomonadota bacterium]|nr:addiction module protein [Pseudomonadota bacterium]
MATTFEAAKVLAMQLSPEQRADLADLLWVSAAQHADIDVAWAAEIEQRLAQVDSGEVETIPYDIVVAELRAKYG